LQYKYICLSPFYNLLITQHFFFFKLLEKAFSEKKKNKLLCSFGKAFLSKKSFAALQYATSILKEENIYILPKKERSS